MNIHEFQAKELFAGYGIPIAKGIAVKAESEFDNALAQLPDGKIVVKAQIHAGGRGKGTFTDGFKGGVHVCPDKSTARETASKMLNNTLVTHQTGPEGKLVKTLYFNEPCAIEKEYYLAITLDRAGSRPVIIASTEGGMDIETVAAETPEKITRVFIDPAQGLQPHHKRSVAFGLGFSDKAQLKQLDKLLTGLYKFYWEKDASLVEINPLITAPDGAIIALDAKVGFDESALFRHPDVVNLRDLDEEDPKEVEASKHGLSYIALDGNIACLVNGAGLAMATMDIIKHFGGNPANFLDVGGGASEEAVTEAFKIILSDPNVEGILVNIFGGIMSCKVIAKGIIAAAKNVEIKVPLVVRLEGNEVKEGKALLDESGLALTSADSLSDAAKKVVELVKASN
ncbi:ADP-forming succinate--CoA ligase subunit beta [Puniceicoccales bacterium CK1056]|uniref:Succinate--CoA ligase [ADP-forming] subunit beta n=1 Tax=Oceanipulchritudo coccoides TaxID=2706888 RepID=A0A6B2LYJ5_9BACT|nr:ADP-forming succinate--CoA ligase subunit beta [Oceanipulchritudo coccoides]NDV61751.1 ADP-forming succinate--CoA ligase subunit beta [Oceanipulchritudo coccoides]